MAKIEKSDKVNYQQICGEKGTFKMMLVGINIGANILENSIKLTYRVESKSGNNNYGQKKIKSLTHVNQEYVQQCSE